MKLSALLLLFVSGCLAAPPEPVPTRESRRARLSAAERFAPVLSTSIDPDDWSDHDLLILDPDPYTVEDLARLRSEGVLTLGYLNIGEAETFRSFYAAVDPGWILGENPRWEGHQFIDARQEGWQRLVLDRVAPRIVSKEFDGLFLDMADVASPGVHPETRDGIVQIIQALRARYPTHLLVMNRGLFLLEEVEDAIDGLVVEGVFAQRDFERATYVPTPAERRDPLVAALVGFRERTGGAALVVDYADTADLRGLAEAEARKVGLPVFVGTLELAGLPDL